MDMYPTLPVLVHYQYRYKYTGGVYFTYIVSGEEPEKPDEADPL